MWRLWLAVVVLGLLVTVACESDATPTIPPGALTPVPADDIPPADLGPDVGTPRPNQPTPTPIGGTAEPLGGTREPNQ